MRMRVRLRVRDGREGRGGGRELAPRLGGNRGLRPETHLDFLQGHRPPVDGANRFEHYAKLPAPYPLLYLEVSQPARGEGQGQHGERQGQKAGGSVVSSPRATQIQSVG